MMDPIPIGAETRIFHKFRMSDGPRHTLPLVVKGHPR